MPPETAQKTAQPAGQPNGGQPVVAPTPGKESAADKANENDWTKPPERYAHMHQDIRQLLSKSKGYLAGQNKGVELPFWEAVDKIETQGLQTLNQIHVGTKAAGLWETIDHIDEREGIYTCGSSWGIHYQGKGTADIVTNGDANDQWGKDAIQFLVQREHGPHGKEYTWYRQNTGAGKPGLHVGLGGTNTNVHWDPTNPMARVGHGFEMTKYGPVYHIKGGAVYDPNALLSHNDDISGGGKPVSNGTATVDPFYSINHLVYCADAGVGFANKEAGETDVKNKSRRDAAVAKIRAAHKQTLDLRGESRRLAQLEPHEDPTGLARLTADHKAARHALFSAFAEFYAYLQAEPAKITDDLRILHQESDWDENKNMMEYARLKWVALVERRRMCLVD